ncbi:MAG: CDP-glycerol glycerophosphotransferase family protein [Oscillospiraceae bacterium]|nr:CDP-glycerol glycerophosphotransferase family protein [Oscillospiraceae bacterium]
MSDRAGRTSFFGRVRIFLRQAAKSILQNVVLPVPYRRAARAPVEKGLVVFADLHTTAMPRSLRELARRVEAEGYRVETRFFDASGLSLRALWRELKSFMQLYARAEFVFICNYFLPASACRKRPETTLIQVWHSGGMFKKFGYDTPDDVLPSYIGGPFRNCDFVLLSSRDCVPVWTGAMRLPPEKFLPVGMPRTDACFSPAYRRRAAERFAALYPEAAGRRVAVWAPTFRGKPDDPALVGAEGFERLRRELGDGWFVLASAHPNMRTKFPDYVTSLPTEDLLPAADLLITDYSSVLFDWLLYRRPFVIYAPDLAEYEKTRGLYIDCRTMPTTVVTDPAALTDAVRREASLRAAADLDEFARVHIGACDGHACDRVLALMRRLSAGEEIRPETLTLEENSLTGAVEQK